jgi:hypothetical protein
MDVRAWRARLLTWSGHLAEAEKEYLEIIKVSRHDPDNWLGLSSVYSRQGKVDDALLALDRAVELDPQRADLHAARARVLRAQGERTEAGMEFQNALHLDPPSAEARAGLLSLRGEPKQELRFGQNNDLFNFASANHDGGVSLVSQWTAHWATSFAASFYERAGVGAEKFSGAVTGRLPRRAALTAGGAVGHDNAVIPKSEAFLGLSHGWKLGEGKFLRSVEFDCGQHCYWYQSSRILTLSAAAIVYLPQDWTLSLGSTGVRSAFSSTVAEWWPSGMARLGFPLVDRNKKRLPERYFSPSAPKISRKSIRSEDALRKPMEADCVCGSRPARTSASVADRGAAARCASWALFLLLAAPKRIADDAAKNDGASEKPSPCRDADQTNHD